MTETGAPEGGAAAFRLALVTETYPPEVNGVARTLSTLVRGLVARGLSVEVVRPRQKGEPRGRRGGSGRAGAPGGAEQHVVPGGPLPRYEGLRFGFPAYFRLKRRWRRRRPAVVHVATEGPLGVSAIYAARHLGIPVSSTFHTNFHQYGDHYGYGFLAGVALRYLRWVHERTAVTLVPSPGIARVLAEDGFPRLGLLGRGVDTVLFDPAKRSPRLRAAWGVGPEDPVAVYVGRIAGEKNVELAVRAFEAFRGALPAERSSGARFVVVGDGPARRALARQCPEVVFAGMRVGEELAAHYASGDLFVFPSLSETFGNVVTEAMASGLPVLAFEEAAAAMHIRDGANGFVVPPGDEAAFLAAAAALAADPERLRAAGRAARETALGIPWERIVEGFERDLRHVAAGGTGPAPGG